MNNGKNIVIALLVAAALSIGSSWIMRPSVDVNSIVSQVKNQVGAATSPEIASPYVCWGGVCNWASHVAMAATSSVVCSLQNPSGATSTLTNFTANIAANGISAAQTLDMSTSSTPVGSTTPAFIFQASVGASAQKSIAWTPGIGTTTNANVVGYSKYFSTGESSYVVGPTDYVTLKVATGTPGTFASYYTGTCSANFAVPIP